jgi:hypothetical protein
VEIVISEKTEEKITFIEKHEFNVSHTEGNLCIYKLDLTINESRSYGYGLRVSPRIHFFLTDLNSGIFTGFKRKIKRCIKNLHLYILYLILFDYINRK